MQLDRRQPSRARLGRRRSERTVLFTDVFWREERNGKAHRGVVVGVSQHGLAMLTDYQTTPRPGARLVPGKHRQYARWLQTAVVTRTESLSDALDLVTATFPAPGGPS